MNHELKVNMNEYLPLRDVVFNTLRQAILKGELEPGERLMEIQLADRLGVSRTPIREAIRKLELEGLVLMIPRKGAEVARISAKSLRDVLEVRRSLEELAIELAIERMADEDLEELAEQIQLLYDEELIANKSQEDYMQDLRSEIVSMKENKYTIVGYEVSPSTDVEFFTEKEDSCARLYCNFYVKQGAGNVPSLEQFVLRKDGEGHWKILGWDLVNE